ncbi:MAG: restriction endonuclease subunit S [Peptococcaceae bacterium]|nr:restriction endonuclease subunit S [Peptococcaceae bacterium]
MYFNGDSGARSDRFSIKDNLFFEMPILLPSMKEQQKIGDVLKKLDNLITLHQRKYEYLCGDKIVLRRIYANDWEQRKLGDVFEEYSEKNHEELPALMIIQGGGTIRREESDRNLMYDKGNLANYKLIKEGDFIVHLRSFEGGLEVATNTGIISPAYHTFHGENTDSIFYYSYFRSRQFIDTDLKPHVYGIRDGRSIDINGMKTIPVPYTILGEQRAIGKYIETFDKLITLHQRKP